MPFTKCDVWTVVFMMLESRALTFQERLLEQKRAVCRFEETSEIAMHVAERGHRMAWANAGVIDKVKDYFKRGFKESWWSSVYYESSNRTRYDVSKVWRGIRD